jgi:hypothetical protein
MKIIRAAVFFLLGLIACNACNQAPAPGDAAAREPTTVTHASASGTPAAPGAEAPPAEPPIAPSAPDPRPFDQIRAAACTAADGSWRCRTPRPKAVMAFGTAPLVPASWSVATWFLDKQNVSTTASDSNDCITSTTACLHFAEIAIHRWGTYAPALQQATTLNTLSGWLSADLADPLNWQGTGSALQVFATLGAADTVGSGTLAGVVAKSAATNTLLQATLIGGAAAGQMIQNTTHASIAFVFNSLGGGNFELSQPMNNGGAPLFVVSSENNSWVNTDAYTLYNLPAINVGNIDASRALIVFNFEKLNVPSQTILRGSFLPRNSAIVGPAGNSVIMFGANPANGNFFANVDISGANVQQMLSAPIGPATTTLVGFNVLAGDYRNSNGVGTTALQGYFSFSGDWICGGSAGSCNIWGGRVTANALWARIPLSVTESTLQFSNGATFAGNQTLDVQRGARVTFSSSSTATATFLQTAATPFLVNGSTTACSLVLGTGAWACGITVNDANIDAAAGAAGFGSDVLSPPGARITNAAN